MEEYVKKVIIKEIEEINRVNAEIKERKKELTAQKNIEDLKNEELDLKIQLEKLKKENFSLRTSIKAWQITLEEKLKEFKENEIKLNKLYEKIWSEREKFCTEADAFDDEFGILSDWWKSQMSFVSDLEKLKQKKMEEKKCEENIEKIQSEVEEIKEDIRELRKKENVTVVEVHLPKIEEETEVVTPENEQPLAISLEESSKSRDKRRKFDETDEIIQIHSEEIQSPNHELFSMMDVNKVRLASRLKHFAHKNPFVGKVKNFLKTK